MRKFCALLAVLSVVLVGCKKGDEWYDVTTIEPSPTAK